MSWEIVVDEELTVHQEEREVMARPGDDEESSVVQQTVADIFNKEKESMFSGPRTVERSYDTTYHPEWG